MVKSQDIWVNVEWCKEYVNITVKDNGTGFDTGFVRDNSFGMIGMRERVDLLKGEMVIKSIVVKEHLFISNSY